MPKAIIQSQTLIPSKMHPRARKNHPCLCWLECHMCTSHKLIEKNEGILMSVFPNFFATSLLTLFLRATSILTPYPWHLHPHNSILHHVRCPCHRCDMLCSCRSCTASIWKPYNTASTFFPGSGRLFLMASGRCEFLQQLEWAMELGWDSIGRTAIIWLCWLGLERLLSGRPRQEGHHVSEDHRCQWQPLWNGTKGVKSMVLRTWDYIETVLGWKGFWE